ncbi:hypothetical protein EV586_103619 [Tumebacillus sp. BK434]|uniref:hypothetical protein n=1 Tax=Tumebacillus sp. BK434 TaxID=2512169 RepID=UPI00104CBD01|nr:hypothetical protein [Tumebacillus sp. BK434]TCP55960.1 hypothetical protein EV586_103619 [Tumebacillus sp. BK434]
MNLKKIALILSPFLLILLMATPLYLKSSLSAPKVVAATPKEAIQIFMAAAQNNDVDSVIGIVRDDDYEGDFAFQRTDYEQGMQNQTVVAMNILSETKIDANTVEYLLEIDYKEKSSCPEPSMPFKVVRDESSAEPSWKVWLQNWSRDCSSPSSPTYGQLTLDRGTRAVPGFWKQAEHLLKTTLNLK